MSGQQPNRPLRPPLRVPSVISLRDATPNVRQGIPRPIRPVPAHQPQTLPRPRPRPAPALVRVPNIQENPNIFIAGPDANQNQALQQQLRPTRQDPLKAALLAQHGQQPAQLLQPQQPPPVRVPNIQENPNILIVGPDANQNQALQHLLRPTPHTEVNYAKIQSL